MNYSHTNTDSEEPTINSRIDIADSELKTAEGIVRTLTITAFHAGNWQKPLAPEDTQPWVDAINKLVTAQVAKAENAAYGKGFAEGMETVRVELQQAKGVE
jgi:hypothetical protein